MNEKNLSVAENKASVDALAAQAEKVKNLLIDLNEKMTTIANQAESDRIKQMAEGIGKFVGDNQEAIVGNITKEAARIASVGMEMAKEDTVK